MLSEADKDEIRAVIRQYLVDNLTILADVSTPRGGEYGPSGPRTEVELSICLPAAVETDPRRLHPFVPKAVTDIVCSIALTLDGADVEVGS